MKKLTPTYTPRGMRHNNRFRNRLWALCGFKTNSSKKCFGKHFDRRCARWHRQANRKRFRVIQLLGSEAKA